MNEKDKEICSLCDRELAVPFNRHHLLPLSKGGKGTPTILLHKICHNKIHAVFTGMELKRRYNTIESIKEQEEMAAFIKWVAKKEPQFYDSSVRKKR
ncbi:MAG: endonuclease [Flavisolibacter sp.]|nr:endonuclease [Flavisolibacter sp.]